MTPQELYDKAREWAKEDSGNDYILLTHRAFYADKNAGYGEANGEVNASYFGIACMLHEIMRRDSRFRKVAKAVLQGLDEHPEDCIDNQKTTKQ